MSDTNCPNCGAIITGHKCEYCGTAFGDPNIDKKEIIILQAQTDLLKSCETQKLLYEAAIKGMRTYGERRGL